MNETITNVTPSQGRKGEPGLHQRALEAVLLGQYRIINMKFSFI